MLKRLGMRRSIAFGLLLAGIAFSGNGIFLFAKATVAQILLRRAWLAHETHKPWSGADTWPVARLLVPRLGVDLIVLQGAAGSALAFGPGWLESSSAPGTDGQVVLAGHRDTHFNFLKDLRDDDLLILETKNREHHLYRTIRRRVVAEDAVESLAPTESMLLTLLTCYPFDDVTSGPLRFLAQAVRVGKGKAGAEQLFAPVTIATETWRSIRH